LVTAAEAQAKPVAEPGDVGGGSSGVSMKKKWSCIFVAVVVTVVLCGQAPARRRLANFGKDGLRFLTIDKILTLDDDEIDIGTAALLLSRKWSSVKSVHRYRGKLDEMAEDVLDRLKKKNIGKVDYRAVAVINDYIYNQMGFKSIADADTLSCHRRADRA